MYRPALTLTVNNAKSVLESGLRMLDEGQTQFDLSELTVVDSAAVATMLAWQRAARASGKTLVFSNLPTNLQSLVDLYGATELLSLVPDAQAHCNAPHP